MNSLLVAVVAALAGAVASSPLDEASRAIDAGRLDQARLMIADAVKAGAQGAAVERVVADLAFAANDHETALARYELLIKSQAQDPLLIERAGIAALKIGDVGRATNLLERATATPGASWRAWNARGVAADRRGDWAVADRAYATATELAGERGEIANNRGWSLLLRGRWTEALATLEIAAGLAPGSPRIANNVELARAAVENDLPARRTGESNDEWAARINDAGVIANLRGNDLKAVAAFSRAIEARNHWFERAANNLAQVGAAR